MVDIAVSAREDFAAYDTQSNTRVTWDGLLELASVNELSNSGWRSLDKDGVPRGALMGFPDDPKGWALYMQQISAPVGKETRQSLPVIPMEKDVYTQYGPLIDGPAPPDVSEQAKIVAPGTPRIEVVSDGLSGYEVGWVAIAYGWIGPDTTKPANAHVHNSPFITAPSPRYYAQITFDGQVPVVTMPVRAPWGAVGIYIAITAPQATQNAASIAQLFIQRRIDIRSGQVITYKLPGPLTRDERAPANNKSLVGAFQSKNKPERWYGHNAYGVMYSFSTRLTYRFATQFGWSLPQQRTPEFHSRYIGEHKDLRWKQPSGLPSNWLQWQPMFSRGDAYFGLPWLDRGEVAHIRHNDPAHITQKVVSVKYADGNDGTGIRNPDAEIETVTLEGKQQIAVGRYRARVAWYDEDLNLSAPSAPAKDRATGNTYVDIGTLGQTPRIYRPEYGQHIPNATGGTVDRTNTVSSDPLDWLVTRTGFASLLVDPDTVTAQETANLTTTSTFVQLPFAEIYQDEPLDRYTALRLGVNMSRYTGGRIAFRVSYYTAAKVFISSGADWGLVGNVSGGATTQHVIGSTVYVTRRLAKSGATVTPDETIPATARYYRVEYRSIGATAGTGNGPRNMDYVITGSAGMPGLIVPRQVPVDPTVAAGVESTTDKYPRGGYARIEVNPPDSVRHADLAGKNLNAFIYFGPYGTPQSTEYGIMGMPTPVKGGTTKRYSLYVTHQGVSAATNAFKVVCRDRYGRVVADYGYMVPSALGSIAPTRFSKTLTIPPEGVMVEIAEGGLGDGFWRVMAPMLKDGAADATWTDAYSLSGNRSWIFDTGVPGVAEDSVQEFLCAIQQYVHGLTTAIDGSEATDTDYAGTLVSTTYQASSRKDPYYWSAVKTDPTLLPPGRYLRVTVSLTTGSTSLSPYVSQAGVRALRPYGVLLREDGTEFPNGGCILQSFPIVAGGRKRFEFLSDSNEWQQYLSGNWLYTMNGVRLHCLSREGAEAVVAYKDSGKPFLLESWLRKRRIRAFAPAIEFSAVDDGMTFDPEAPDGFWEEQESEAEFRVMNEAVLA